MFYAGVIISILCGYGVRTLNIAPVPDGVVLFGKERLLRENGQVTVFAVIDLDDSAFANTMAPIAEKIEGYIHDLRVDMRPEVQRLLSNRLQRVMRNSSKSNRMRRGLINFVGQVGKALFGLATEEDLTQVQTGMQQIADQTDVLISDHNKLVAIVNRVGAEQISQLNKVNELVNRTNVLHTQITAVSTYVSEIVQNISIAWTHMKFRTNVEYLISDVESRYRDFQELRNYMRDLKLSCEVGSVTEELLPVQLLRRIISDSRNQNSLTNEWYYRTLKVETMFRDRSGRLVCKYTVPLLASEPYLAYNIHTYPVFNPNASLALRLYHDVYVAIGTRTGELFYPEQCKGIDPVVCHAGLRYDKSRELCVRGLISGSPQQQSRCPVSLFKSIDNSQSVKEVTRNKFVVHTPHEHYSYRCPDQKPLVDEITYGTYVIEIDQNCLLDTSSWMLEGLTYHEIYQYFNISDIEIPNIPILNSNSWHKFHTLLIDANVIDRLDLPTFDDVPTISPMHVHLEVKKPFYKLWFFWLILLIIVVILGMISLYVYFNGCLTMKSLLNTFSDNQILVNAASTSSMVLQPRAAESELQCVQQNDVSKSSIHV